LVLTVFVVRGIDKTRPGEQQMGHGNLSIHAAFIDQLVTLQGKMLKRQIRRRSSMIIAHYRHRLPENYDDGPIRALTKERSPLWDARPELYFKAFLLRQAGRSGAIANSFSSLYLWRQDGAYRDWLVNGGYKTVTNVFGRAEIETHFALDARKGPGYQARFGYTEDLDIPLDGDLTAAFAREIERNREIAAQRDTVASTVGVDTRNWKITRIQLSTNEPNGNGNTVAYQILHLARPFLDTLPKGDDR
jgi:hypothetical protein